MKVFVEITRSVVDGQDFRSAQRSQTAMWSKGNEAG
jgi:hypothetical protein